METSLFIILLCYSLLVVQGNDDRLKMFYNRIVQPDAKYCSDRTRLLPDCKECIPGLKVGAGSSTCNEYIPASKAIRDEIGKLTKERYGHDPVPDRPFGLYPCKIISIPVNLVIIDVF